ncbi:MAG: type II secretion system protein [Phycisphaerae bacterium]
MSRARLGNRRKAFTLIELLAVIAIIALLVSILVPSLAQAREISRRAVCMMHFKALGEGIHFYVSDSAEVIPPAYLVFRPDPEYWCWYWADFIAPYVDSRCRPSHPAPGQQCQQSVARQPLNGVYERLTSSTASGPPTWGVPMAFSRMMNCPGQKWTTDYRFHYAWNVSTGWAGQVWDLGQFNWTSPLAWKLTNFKRASDYCAILEPSVAGEATSSGFADWACTNGNTPGQLSHIIATPIHLKSFNGVMLDGSARNFTYSFLAKYIQEETQRGYGVLPFTNY